jgi:hypothetical protein
MIPGGSAIASGTAALHKAVSGSGLYKGRGMYAANDTIQGSGSVMEAPRFAPMSDGGTGVVISHREYVCDVYGPGAGNLSFENQTFALNPGMEQTFPWLSQVACNYEEYELLQCIFSYKSTTTDIGSSTTGQCGTVVMATQYDVSDEPFSDKETMLRYALSESCKSTAHMLHGVECDPTKLSGSPGKYVRNQPVLPNQDLKDYDAGLFNLALANIPAAYANQSLGELWITYTVRLRKPKLVSAKAFNIERSIYASSASKHSTDISQGILNVPASAMCFGQQNSIAAAIGTITAPVPVPPPTGYLYSPQSVINFPAPFSGNCEIVVTLQLPPGTGAGGAILKPSAIGLAGNVRPINDIPNWLPTGVVWVNRSEGLAEVGGNLLDTYILRLHVDVGIATQGVDNQVFLALCYDPFKNPQIVTQTVEIAEYNTSINYKQNGTDDRVMLVDYNNALTNL